MSRFGRNQQIALGALTAPFIVATIALFLDKATFADWSGFNQYLIPVVVGITLGASAIKKAALGFAKGKDEESSNLDVGSTDSDSRGPSGAFPE